MLKEIETREYNINELKMASNEHIMCNHVSRQRRIDRANLEYWQLRAELALEEAGYLDPKED